MMTNASMARGGVVLALPAFLWLAGSAQENNTRALSVAALFVVTAEMCRAWANWSIVQAYHDVQAQDAKLLKRVEELEHTVKALVAASNASSSADSNAHNSTLVQTCPERVPQCMTPAHSSNNATMVTPEEALAMLNCARNRSAESNVGSLQDDAAPRRRTSAHGLDCAKSFSAHRMLQRAVSHPATVASLLECDHTQDGCETRLRLPKSISAERNLGRSQECALSRRTIAHSLDHTTSFRSHHTPRDKKKMSSGAAFYSRVVKDMVSQVRCLTSSSKFLIRSLHAPD